MSSVTPTRKERRDQARRARMERERTEAAAAGRRRLLTRLGAVLAVAAIVVVGLIAVSGSGSGNTASNSSSSQIEGAVAARSLLAGVPQRGITLGDPKAPVRVVEFADLQCPFCRNYSQALFPSVVRDYVRPGRVRMEFRSLAFIGPDSERAARVAEAAGAQNRLWNVVDLVYANQGMENSGWATDALLRRVAGSVPGLDVNRVFSQRNSPTVTGQLEAAQTLATRSGVNSTPTFLVGRGNNLKAVDAAGLPGAIKAALGQ
jgi:protein-disulfide isomerase